MPGDRYRVFFTEDPDLIRAAHRLRRQHFTTFPYPYSCLPGSDSDVFDEYCDQLVVRAVADDRVVATMRMLPLARGHSEWTDERFDRSTLRSLDRETISAGGQVVHPDHRDGEAVGLMYSALAEYVARHRASWVTYLVGVPLADGGVTAAGVWELVRTKHMSPPGLRVRPRRPWTPPAAAVEPVATSELFTHIRGPIRLGGVVCGPPAWDAGENLISFYCLIEVSRVLRALRRHQGVA